MKDPYNAMDYNGRACDKILDNLDKIEIIVGEDLFPIVETMKSFKEVKRVMG